MTKMRQRTSYVTLHSVIITMREGHAFFVEIFNHIVYNRIQPLAKSQKDDRQAGPIPEKYAPSTTHLFIMALFFFVNNNVGYSHYMETELIIQMVFQNF